MIHFQRKRFEKVDIKKWKKQQLWICLMIFSCDVGCGRSSRIGTLYSRTIMQEGTICGSLTRLHTRGTCTFTIYISTFLEPIMIDVICFHHAMPAKRRLSFRQNCWLTNIGGGLDFWIQLLVEWVDKHYYLALQDNNQISRFWIFAVRKPALPSCAIKYVTNDLCGSVTVATNCKFCSAPSDEDSFTITVKCNRNSAY